MWDRYYSELNFVKLSENDIIVTEWVVMAGISMAPQSLMHSIGRAFWS